VGLKRLAADYRREVYGPSHFETIKDFYYLKSTQGRTPTFRPAVQVPHLQLMGVTEASDLADMNPRIYVVNRKGERERDREAALQSAWRDSFGGNQLLHAALWSFLNGNGYLQPGFDRYARGGRGQVWFKRREPDTVYVDPACDSEEDWHYVQFDDRLYPEQIAEAFPQTGQDVDAPPPSGVKESPTADFALSLPRNSPMSIPGGPPEERIGPSDGRTDVTYTFIFDPSVEDVVRDSAGADEAKKVRQPTRFKLKYPNGRLIVSSTPSGRILFDGDSPNPSRRFPLVRLLGMPALSGFYAPPPYMYTESLQRLAERMLTQTFENAARLNNGIWFIPDNSGISPEDFGGIPGEVRTYSSQSQPPKLEMVKPFPPHMVQFPQLLLALQEKLQGFTSARQGNPGAGNVGSELFDAAVLQSQSMTRMRAKFMWETVTRLATQMFQLMAAYLQDDRFPSFSEGFAMKKWERIGAGALDDYELYVDESSTFAMSQLAMQKMVPTMRKEGLLDTKSALEMLGVPNAAEIAAALEDEQKLNALARLKKR
jgi:hypothetical protein